MSVYFNRSHSQSSFECGFCSNIGSTLSTNDCAWVPLLYVHSTIVEFHTSPAPCRFCVRFLPVVLVCPAFLDDIKRHIPGALKEFHDPDVGAIKVSCVLVRTLNSFGYKLTVCMCPSYVLCPYVCRNYCMYCVYVCV